MSGATSVDVPLSKPITAHDKEVSVLTLRAPTVDDVIQIGMPQLLIPSADGTSVAVEVRIKIIAQYIVKLAGIPFNAVKQLALVDLMHCQGVVMDFFGEDAGGTPES